MSIKCVYVVDDQDRVVRVDRNGNATSTSDMSRKALKNALLAAECALGVATSELLQSEEVAAA